MTENGLVPISTDKDPAPLAILNSISCKCIKGCMTTACTCRKAGLKCSIICASCKGISCTNSDVSLDEEECDDPTDVMLENSLITECAIWVDGWVQRVVTPPVRFHCQS